jgi:GNAT superfamily N-acetyltransferase
VSSEIFIPKEVLFMNDPVLRAAKLADIPVLALFRRLMFEDMEAAEQHGYDPQELHRMESVFGEYAHARLGGELQAWVMEVDDRIVSCAAVSVLPYIPGPGRLDMRIALLHNVQTLPEYRHRGFARRLVETAVDWCRQQGFTSVVLNASDAGRPLYTSMGFHPTNQMILEIH